MLDGQDDRCPLRLLALVALYLVVIAGCALAQSRRVNGTVSDERGRPIRGATVVAENPDAAPRSFTATSDDRGRFSIAGLEKGIWRFTASAPGYVPAQQTGDVSMLERNQPVEFKLAKGGAGPGPPLASVDAKALQGELDAAQVLFNAKQYDQAIGAYRAVLARVPSLTLVNLQIGNAYRLKGDYDRALAAYQEVLKSDPANEQAKVAVGLTNLERGDLKAAEQALAEAASAGSAGREAFYGLGEVKVAMGQPDEAARWYQRAADADPTWVKPVYRLGVLAAARDDREAAVAFMQKVIALAPESSEAAQAKAALERIRKQAADSGL